MIKLAKKLSTHKSLGSSREKKNYPYPYDDIGNSTENIYPKVPSHVVLSNFWTLQHNAPRLMILEAR